MPYTVTFALGLFVSVEVGLIAGTATHLCILLYKASSSNKTYLTVAWLPDGYSQIFRSYVFGPSGFWTMAPLRYTAK